MSPGSSGMVSSTKNSGAPGAGSKTEVTAGEMPLGPWGPVAPSAPSAPSAPGSPTAVVYLQVQDRPQRHHFEAMVIRFDLIVLSSLRTTT